MNQVFSSFIGFMDQCKILICIGIILRISLGEYGFSKIFTLIIIAAVILHCYTK